MNRAHFLFTGLLALAVASGCGPQDGGSLAFRIYSASPDPASTLRGDVPEHIRQKISDFRICVSADDMDKAKCQNFNLSDYDKTGKATVSGLPTGKDRRVTFQGYDYSNAFEVHYCGEVSGIDVNKNSTTPVTMFISACRDFSAVRNDMNSPRVFHTATPLPDGRVLIIGGFNVLGDRQACPGSLCRTLAATNSVDLYDPVTGEFEDDPGFELTHARGFHTSTLLPDGKVLVAGGCQNGIHRVGQELLPLFEVNGSDGFGPAGTVAEIIDPVAKSVTPLENEKAMPTSRALHQAFLLPNGDVFLVGGMGPSGNQSVAWGTYFLAATQDFVDQTGTAPLTMSVARQGMALVALADGQAALLWGGNHPPSTGAGTFAEILRLDDQNSVSFEIAPFVTSQPGQGIPAFYSNGVALGTDEVLITGGVILDRNFDPNLSEPRATNKYRLIDMGTGAETIVAPDDPNNTINFFCGLHTATLLGKRNQVDHVEDPGVKVLVAGGLTASQPADVVFEPQDKATFFLSWETENNHFTQEQIRGSAVSMTVPRAGHTATPLRDGTVLFAGGFTQDASVLSIAASAEVFNAAPRELRRE